MLFNGSVFENIANGLVGTKWEAATEEDQMQRVQDAAKLAFAHDFIQSLPQGYHTRIGERGGLLSGGQKQRIAIARSVISEPKILLLDEATSALDPHAEGIVQKALDSASANRTTIVIAHKLATIRNADNIVVMSKGKIMEQGRHEELVQQNGIYATLVKAQDLTPANLEKNSGLDGTSLSSEASEKEDDFLVRAPSLTKIRTAEEQQAMALKDREDHDLYKRSGIIRNIWKLLRGTPDLWLWFAVTTATCIAGGEWPYSAEKCSQLEARRVPVAHNFVIRSCGQPWPSALAGQHHERLYLSGHGRSRQLHRIDVLRHVARYSRCLLHHGMGDQHYCTGAIFHVSPVGGNHFRPSHHDTDTERAAF